MLQKQEQAYDPLRQSFVPMGLKSNHIYLSFKQQQPVTSEKLLARYHDESFILPEQIQVELIRDRCLYKYRQLTAQLSVINPQSALLTLWYILTQLAIIYHFFEIPIGIFFTGAVYETQFKTSTGVALNVITTILIFVNIIFVRALTGFYKGGTLIKSPRLIISRYARFEMILNIFAWLALLIYVCAGVPSLIYLKLGFYLMAFSLYKIDDVILLKLQLKRLTLATYRLIKLIVILLFVVLWISCVYFAIDYHYYLKKEQYYPVNLWLTNSICSQYSNGTFIDLAAVYPWYVWLNYAFYWTLQSITGVGYGDMTPRNPQEVVYCNFVILFMSIAYAFFINSIWDIIAEVNETGDSREKHMKIVKKYRKKYEIEPNLTNRLGSYIYEIWTHEKTEETENNIKQSLSEDLRAQLLLIRQRQFFSKVPFFHDKFDRFPEIFQQLAHCLKEVKYGQDQVIFQQGVFHQKMCSVLVGQVKIYYENSKLAIKLDKDCLFGIADFLANKPSSYSAIAKTFCKITYIDYSTFIHKIKKRSIIYEILAQNKEDLQRNNRHQISGENCWVCSNPAHPAHLCVEYFDWMPQMRQFENAVRRKQLKQSNQFYTNVRHARKFFNRRKTDKAAKVINIQSLKLAQVDVVTSYKFYRPKFSI